MYVHVWAAGFVLTRRLTKMLKAQQTLNPKPQTLNPKLSPLKSQELKVLLEVSGRHIPEDVAADALSQQGFRVGVGFRV